MVKRPKPESRELYRLAIAARMLPKAELLALQAQLRALQQHKGLNDTISQQRKDLWTTEAKFQVLEEASRSRSLTKQEQSLLASKDQCFSWHGRKPC